VGRAAGAARTTTYSLNNFSTTHTPSIAHSSFNTDKRVVISLNIATRKKRSTSNSQRLARVESERERERLPLFAALAMNLFGGAHCWALLSGEM